MILQGKKISDGVAAGKSHLIGLPTLLAAALKILPQGNPDSEVERLNAAVALAEMQLVRLRRQLQGKIPQQDVGIFGAHSGMLRDGKFLAKIEEEIRRHGRSAESAVARVVKELFAGLMGSGLPLAQDKSYDILDIGRRLVRCLSPSGAADEELGEHRIIIASSLTPSELVRYVRMGAKGFITETCGVKSHTAILARGFGLPLVTGITEAQDRIPQDASVIIDGERGLVFLNPTPEEQPQVDSLLQQIRGEEETPVEALEPRTQDGEQITLLMNISAPAEAFAVSRFKAAGIGLFRTEFLYIDRDGWLTSDESLAIYKDVADRLGSLELNVRLVDFGAEKSPAYADIPVNRNPSLGLRGIRLLLQREDIMKPQVVALEKLARERPITVHIPMLDTLDTWDSAVEKLCRFSGCRKRAELPFKLGAMIEVPSAALMIDQLAPEVDAFSIGLNDLTQYLLAADRDDEVVGSFHDAMQPAVLRLVRQLVESAATFERPLTVCGELAGDPQLTGLMLGLGIRRFSVSRSNYRDVVRLLNRLSIARCRDIAQEILQMRTGAQIREFVSRHLLPQ